MYIRTILTILLYSIYYILLLQKDTAKLGGSCTILPLHGIEICTGRAARLHQHQKQTLGKQMRKKTSDLSLQTHGVGGCVGRMALLYTVVFRAEFNSMN